MNLFDSHLPSSSTSLRELSAWAPALDAPLIHFRPNILFAIHVMCFVLYIATPKPLPIVPWDDQTRGIHTEQLSEHSRGVAVHFHNPHVYYIGSDTHCGCGFRNASYQNGCWPEEEWRPEDDTSHIEAQPNHQRLVELIRTHLPGVASFEFYGMWEADVGAPALSDQSIALERLLDLDFYFRDRGHYSVSIDKGEQSAGGNAG